MKRILIIAMLLGGSAIAHAQTALETVAFLALGIDKSDAGSSSFREEVTSTEKELRYKLFGGSRTLSDLSITETAKCAFKIEGSRFHADKIIKANYTIDFNSMLPQEPRNMRNTDENNVFWKVAFYMVIPGVTVCSKGESFPFTRENFPPTGECTDSMKTNYVQPGGHLDRQISALKYLRQNYCKGRAF